MRIQLKLRRMAAELVSDDVVSDEIVSDHVDNVPDVKQETVYSCGAASFRMVLGYYGIDITEDKLRYVLETSEENGTHFADMARGASYFGLQVEWKQGMSLAEANRALRNGWPVIVRAESEIVGKSWLDTWTIGHYMVLTDVEDGIVKLEDPWTGKTLEMARQEFEDSWHSLVDTDDGLRKHRQEGMIVKGKPNKYFNTSGFSNLLNKKSY